MFRVPEEYRIKTGPMGFDTSYGSNGVFYIPLDKKQKIYAFAIAGEGLGWEHVAVTIRNTGNIVTPTWDNMCRVKDLFWEREDCVVQYHPPRSQYVNNHSKCLHLWRPVNQQLPIPPPILVGIKP